jgi:hypothetical protein
LLFYRMIGYPIHIPKPLLLFFSNRLLVFKSINNSLMRSIK